jgi:glutamate carboxypeptidase
MNTLPADRIAQSIPAMVGLLKELVEIESPSTDKAAVDRAGRRIQQELADIAANITSRYPWTTARVDTFPSASAGDTLAARFGEGEGGLLLLSHMDTVFDIGMLAVNPLREADGRLYGPGVFDMKASIAMLLCILRLFAETGQWPRRPITALFTPDEEIGSDTSRAIIEAEARKAGMVFCLEPAMANGALKTSRKGTGDIEVRVRGVAAHAGVNHDQGRNAIEELAHHILSAQQLTDYSIGTTVNVGVVRGGTRRNVVPDEAFAGIDFRIARPEDYARLEAWARSRTPVIPGTSLEVLISTNRPPMPRDETMARSFARAQEIGRALGLELSEASTGGGSDANFVAPLGVPVLDGLGPIGDGAHSEREYVRIDSLSERAGLLAAMLLNW